MTEAAPISFTVLTDGNNSIRAGLAFNDIGGTVLVTVGKRTFREAVEAIREECPGAHFMDDCRTRARYQLEMDDVARARSGVERPYSESVVLQYFEQNWTLASPPEVISAWASRRGAGMRLEHIQEALTSLVRRKALRSRLAHSGAALPGSIRVYEVNIPATI
jgi:hypothetical protein